MRNRIIALLLCLVLSAALLPTTVLAEATALTELHITGSLVSVTAGVLPEIDAEVAEGEHASVQHSQNTSWSKKTGKDSYNGFGFDIPTAVDDGVTSYVMRLCIDVDKGYAITYATRIFYNGKQIPDAVFGAYDWGAYVMIDLGKASGENVQIHTVTFVTNGGSEISDAYVPHGREARLREPSKYLSVFTGWYRDAACSVPYDPCTPVTSDLTLYAGWKDSIVLTDLHITGPLVSVTAGKLPAIDAEVAEGEHASVQHSQNTSWSKKTGKDSYNGFGFDIPTAVDDGVTSYVMRLCIDVDEGYAITYATRIFYNGKQIPDAVFGAYGWGAYVMIDLGRASGENAQICTITFDANGGGGTMADVTLPKENDGFIVPECGFSAPAGKKFDKWEYTYVLGETADTATVNPGGKVMIWFDSAFKALWKEETTPHPTSYTVEFQTYGGAPVPGKQIVEAGKKAVKPADPQKGTDLVFGGWYTDTTFTEKFDFNSAINANTTVYARWMTPITGIKITVPTPIAGTTRAEADSSAVIVTVPADAVEAHDGNWWNVSDGSYFTGTFEAGKSYSFGTNLSPKAGYCFECDGDLYLGAIAVEGGTFEYTESDGKNLFVSTVVQCTEAGPESCKVLFRMGGHGEQIKTQVVKKGGKAVRPADPTEEGYVFGGWYADVKCTEAFDFNAAITESTAVYAKWTEKTAEEEKCMVSVEVWDTENHKWTGGLAAIKTKNPESGYLVDDGYGWSAAKGETVEIRAQAKEGYTFVKWVKDDETFSTFSEEAEYTFTVTENIDLYAVFQRDGAAEEKCMVSVEVWDTENHKWTGGLAAIKTKNPESGYLVDDGYGWSAVKGETVEIRAQAKEGYTFVKWVKDDETFSTFSEEAEYTFTVTENIDLYAVFQKNGAASVISAASASVSGPLDGAAPDMAPVSGDGDKYDVEVDYWYLYENPYPHLSASDPFAEGKVYELRIKFTPKVGYAFDENTVFTVNGEATDAYSMIDVGARCLRLKAAASCTVSFRMNGRGGQIAEQKVAVGGKAVRPAAPTEEGCVFAGWYADEKCTAAFDFDSAINADTTVYARWIDTPIPITGIKITVPKLIAGTTRAGADSSAVIVTVPADAVEAHDGNWWNVSDGSYFNGTFEAGKSYSFGITLSPKDGYIFECDGDLYLGAIAVEGGTFEYTESDGKNLFLSTIVQCTDADFETDAPEGQKGKGGLVFLWIALAFVLAGAAGGAFWYFRMRKPNAK